MLRAPAFINQRWKSATGSLPRVDWLRLPDWPLLLDEPALLDESVLLDQLSARGVPSLRELPPPDWLLLLVLGWPLLFQPLLFELPLFELLLAG
jgi:hypothetical protein